MQQSMEVVGLVAAEKETQQDKLEKENCARKSLYAVTEKVVQVSKIVKQQAEEEDDKVVIAHNEEEESRPAISCPPRLSLPHPWLVIFDGAEDRRQTFYSISHDYYYRREIPEMKNKLILSSQQGWLFLEDNETDECCLFNMFTLEKLQLPPLNQRNYHQSVLSSHTIDSGCRILVIFGYMLEFRSCYLGDNEFVERELRCDTYPYRTNNPAVVKFEGKLYALSFEYDLMVADFADPELSYTTVISGYDSLDPRLLKITDDMKFYLVESSGKILFVHVNRLDYDCFNIKIYRADLDMKKWVVEKSLGDQALFLDYYKALSSPASSELGVKGNCVYYVNGSSGDRSLYVYDLKDGSTTISLPCPTVSNEGSSLYWAM